MPLHYRGFSNLRAVADDLDASWGLGAASDLILSGDSAGGLATLWHADFFTGRFPKARVVAAPDSGYFFADPVVSCGLIGWRWCVNPLSVLPTPASCDHQQPL